MATSSCQTYLKPSVLQSVIVRLLRLLDHPSLHHQRLRLRHCDPATKFPDQSLCYVLGPWRSLIDVMAYELFIALNCGCNVYIQPSKLFSMLEDRLSVLTTRITWMTSTRILYSFQLHVRCLVNEPNQSLRFPQLKSFFFPRYIKLRTTFLGLASFPILLDFWNTFDIVMPLIYHTQLTFQLLHRPVIFNASIKMDLTKLSSLIVFPVFNLRTFCFT